MRMRWMALILIVSVGGMQASAATRAAQRQVRMAQAATAGQSAVPAQVPVAPVGAGVPAAGTIEVPAGTKVELNLVTQIMSVSTRPGDTVRAVVAFPVTVGNQLAIPAGTFVEGQLVVTKAAKATKKVRYGAGSGTAVNSGLQIHFTRLVYANGYTVSLDAQNAEVKVTGGSNGTEVASAEDAIQMPVAHGHGPDGGAAFLDGQIGQPFPPPQLPAQPKMPGPNPAVVIGGALGGLALVGLISLLLAKSHGKSTDSVLYDAGWQFSMALTSALKLDAAQVMDAARMAPAAP